MMKSAVVANSEQFTDRIESHASCYSYKPDHNNINLASMISKYPTIDNKSILSKKSKHAKCCQ